MSSDNTPKQEPLADKEIVSAKKISRRSLLASTGIGLGIAAGATAIVTASTKKASAFDKKRVDHDRRDPDRD